MRYVGSKKVHSKKANEEAAYLLRFILGCYTVSFEQYAIPNRSQRQTELKGRENRLYLLMGAWQIAVQNSV